MEIKEIRLKAKLLIDRSRKVPREEQVYLMQVEPEEDAPLLTCVELWSDFEDDEVVEITIRKC